MLLLPFGLLLGVLGALVWSFTGLSMLRIVLLLGCTAMGLIGLVMTWLCCATLNRQVAGRGAAGRWSLLLLLPVLWAAAGFVTLIACQLSLADAPHAGVAIGGGLA